MTDSNILLEAVNLKKHFPIRGGVFRKTVGFVHSLNGVSFSLRRGETLGLVGESGSGKSTLGRTLLRLYEPTEGKIIFDGQDITSFDKSEMAGVRRHMAMIFQDPYTSLNPRMKVSSIIQAPMKAHGVGTRKERRDRVAELLEIVGLRAAANRFPHEFSGGQRQRIGIARALILNPKLIVADEPVSALDVSIQAQVINLMSELKERFGLTYVFIAHNLAVVEHISTSVAIMYLGYIVEKAASKTLYGNPKHPYTQALMDAVPVPDPTKRKTHRPLQGEIPSPIKLPTGCVFHTRCPLVEPRCKSEFPLLRNVGGDGEEHWVACHLAEKSKT